MGISIKTSLFSLSLAGLVAACPASAAEWSRDTIHGGRVTRSITGEGPVYSGQTTRVGPNGGSYSSSATCLNGTIDRCQRSFSATGPHGKTYSGQRATASGPYQVRSIGTLTGPKGRVAVGGSRRWR